MITTLLLSTFRAAPPPGSLTPKAAALVPIPMVIETGGPIIDHERHEPTWPLADWQTIAAFDQAVGKRGCCDCVALHDTRLRAVCPTGLRVCVRPHVSTVVVAVVVGLNIGVFQNPGLN